MLATSSNSLIGASTPFEGTSHKQVAVCFLGAPDDIVFGLFSEFISNFPLELWQKQVVKKVVESLRALSLVLVVVMRGHILVEKVLLELANVLLK